MTEMRCGYAGDRDDVLVAYLYDDIDSAARAAFETHLTSCDRCRSELDAMRGVRRQLARWNPPEPAFGGFVGQSRVISPQSDSGLSAAGRNPQWWRDIPAWAQVAAALLFLGVSAGIANLEVRYDGNGLAVRTGWWTPAERGPQPSGVAQRPGDAAPWRGDLTALERQLRSELRGAQASAVNAVARPASSASDAEVMRKVRVLIDESERRQQSELALRVAQVITDVNTARQADLRRIDLTLNRVQDNLGVEVLKNRQSMQYLMRVNQRQ